MDRPFLYPVVIDATHLDDAWHQALRKCFQYGYEYEVTHGSYEGQNRYEFDFVTILIRRPFLQMVPIMPEGLEIPPPTSMEKLETYFANYLMMDMKSPKEDYRYGERLVNPKLRLVERPDLSEPHVPVMMEGDEEIPPVEMGVDQVLEALRMFHHAGEGTNQVTMEIAMPNDILLKDPPCLRLIDCRLRYGKLHFFVYFRSWDLYAGLPENLGGLELLKQYMAQEIGCENGSMIAASKGLHIYSQYYEIVESQLKMSLEDLRHEGHHRLHEIYG